MPVVGFNEMFAHLVGYRLPETTSAPDSLAALLPDEAEKVQGDDVVDVGPDELVLGDLVIVRPGSSVPADGRIADGSASKDESMVTGESKPVRRETNDHVVAGAVATGVRGYVTAIGEDTALARQRIADTADAVLFDKTGTLTKGEPRSCCAG